MEEEEKSGFWTMLGYDSAEKFFDTVDARVLWVIPFGILMFMVYTCSETNRERSVDEIMGRTPEQAAARKLEVEREIQAGKTLEDVYRESAARGYATISQPNFVATKREYAFLIGLMNEDEIERYSDDDTIIYLTKGTSVRVIKKDEYLIEGEVQGGTYFGKRVFVPNEFTYQ